MCVHYIVGAIANCALRGIVITVSSSCAEATDQKPAAERVWKEMLPTFWRVKKKDSKKKDSLEGQLCILDSIILRCAFRIVQRNAQEPSNGCSMMFNDVLPTLLKSVFAFSDKCSFRDITTTSCKQRKVHSDPHPNRTLCSTVLRKIHSVPPGSFMSKSRPVAPSELLFDRW